MINSCQKCFLFSKTAFTLSILLTGCAYESRKGETFVRHIGTYLLDINRTNLGEYNIDSNLYKNLKITFYADSTFIMNMHVPFFADNRGKWIAGDGMAYSYNQLYFESKEYLNIEGDQFFPPYLDKSDIIFLINGAQPKKSKPHVQRIYFKKIEYLKSNNSR